VMPGHDEDRNLGFFWIDERISVRFTVAYKSLIAARILSRPFSYSRSNWQGQAQITFAVLPKEFAR